MLIYVLSDFEDTWDLMHVCFYCLPRRTRKFFHKQPSVDNVSETSVTDESMSESTTASVPRVRAVISTASYSEAVMNVNDSVET